MQPLHCRFNASCIAIMSEGLGRELCLWVLIWNNQCCDWRSWYAHDWWRKCWGESNREQPPTVCKIGMFTKMLFLYNSPLTVPNYFLMIFKSLTRFPRAYSIFLADLNEIRYLKCYHPFILICRWLVKCICLPYKVPSTWNWIYSVGLIFGIISY